MLTYSHVASSGITASVNYDLLHYVYLLILSFLSQSEQQLHYPSTESQYTGKPVSMALPLHPSLLEHYLPHSLDPPKPLRAPEESNRPSANKTPYSEGEDSDAGERSEGELVVLTD